jgi:predicted flap endonuclease-1-like 5' DNA nuclease
MREVAETHEAIEEAQAKVEDHFSDYTDDEKWDKTEMLIAAPGLTVADAAELHVAGVKDVEDLQEKAATAAGRKELAEAADLSRDEVDAIAYQLDLGRVRGVGRKSLALLNAAGIESVGDLAEYDADELAGLLTTVNEEEHIVEHMPSMDTLAFWIDQARELPPYLVAIKVLKEMLDVDAYSWHAAGGDDPKKRRADAILFNRKEGYEVRLMIQKICNTFGFTSEEDVKRVESVIANELPGNVRSQENVYNWLVDYFETH